MDRLALYATSRSSPESLRFATRYATKCSLDAYRIEPNMSEHVFWLEVTATGDPAVLLRTMEAACDVLMEALLAAEGVDDPAVLLTVAS